MKTTSGLSVSQAYTYAIPGYPQSFWLPHSPNRYIYQGFRLGAAVIARNEGHPGRAMAACIGRLLQDGCSSESIAEIMATAVSISCALGGSDPKTAALMVFAPPDAFLMDYIRRHHHPVFSPAADLLQAISKEDYSHLLYNTGALVRSRPPFPGMGLRGKPIKWKQFYMLAVEDLYNQSTKNLLELPNTELSNKILRLADNFEFGARVLPTHRKKYLHE